MIGDGRPVLLLHGFPDTGRLWRHQVPALAAAGFRVIVPDLRGYGRSDKPTEVEAYALVALAGDVLAVMSDAGSSGRTSSATIGAPPSPGASRARRTDVDHLVAISVGHPSTMRRAASSSTRSPGTCCCSSSPASPRSGCRRTAGRISAPGAPPRRGRIIAELEANGSLTPALNYYRANLPPETWLRPVASCRRSMRRRWASGAGGHGTHRAADDRLRVGVAGPGATSESMDRATGCSSRRPTP